MKRLLCITVGVLGVLGVPGIAAAQVCTVGEVGHLTIQASVADTTCVTIIVPEGEYFENLSIKRSVTITGAGADKTILNGGARASGRTVTVMGPVAVRMGQMTIKNGVAPTLRTDPSQNNGGGVLVGGGASLSLDHVVVRDNRAVAGAGGGIMVGRGSILAMFSSAIVANAAQSGGGIYSTEAIVYIHDSVIGGVSSADGNQAREGGGLMAASGTSATLSTSQVMNNRATGLGGGVLVDSTLNSTSLTMEDGSLFDNEAAEGGGLASRGESSAQVNLTRSLVAGNKATGGRGGGVLWGDDNTLSVANTTMSGNSAENGGSAVDLFNTVAEPFVFLANSTITNNTTKGAGAALVGTSPFVFVDNTIVSGNLASTDSPSAVQADCSVSGTTSRGHNIFGQNGLADGCPVGAEDLILPGSVASVLNPFLARNGGPTRTHLPVDGGPAVDSGGDRLGDPVGGLDQRGVDRPFNGRSDIGAVELLFNRAPVVDADDPYTVAEGGTVTLAASNSTDEDETSTELKYAWDLDLDPAGTFEVTGAAAEFSAESLDGPTSRTVRVQVCDNGIIKGYDGAPYAETTSKVSKCSVSNVEINVDNVAPDVTVAASDVNEGSAASLSGSISDPGTGDTFTVSINWGDGSAATSLTLEAGAQSFSAQHVFLDDSDNATDTFEIQVIVTDDDGGEGSAAASSIVSNVPPSDGALTTTGTVEGGSATLAGTLIDPGTLDPHTVVINWGPGETPTTLDLPAGVMSFSASHLYADDNPTGTSSDSYTVGVTISDDDGGVALAGGWILVTNAAPSVIAGADETNPTGPTSITASFVDAGVLDTRVGRINWGDGVIQSVSVPGSGGSGELTAQHNYASAGVFTIEICVTDDDGSTGCDTLIDTVTSLNTGGLLTGGVLTANGGRALFAVRSQGTKIYGVVDFFIAGKNFLAIKMTSFSISADRRSATFSGIGLDGRTFEAYIEDNPEPGRRDVFRLKIAGTLRTDGNIAAGNISIRR